MAATGRHHYKIYRYQIILPSISKVTNIYKKTLWVFFIGKTWQRFSLLRNYFPLKFKAIRLRYNSFTAGHKLVFTLKPSLSII
jgi:hypothetical protein